jgi:hypothetical protein
MKTIYVVHIVDLVGGAHSLHKEAFVNKEYAYEKAREIALDGYDYTYVESLRLDDK